MKMKKAGKIIVSLPGKPGKGRNITLIGMAGAGKSFIGQELAKRLGYDFLDIDRIIEQKAEMKLQKIIDSLGESKFLEFEEQSILALDNLKKCVVSPGGSAVYSAKAIAFLKEISIIILLTAPFRAIQERLGDMRNRGIIGLRDKDLKTLFDERTLLY
jgi:shikimate kinase